MHWEETREALNYLKSERDTLQDKHFYSVPIQMGNKTLPLSFIRLMQNKIFYR